VAQDLLWPSLTEDLWRINEANYFINQKD